MDQQLLKDVLDLHRKWVLGEASGKRADLRSADLRSADLSFADLSFADLSFANLSFANLRSADLRFADLSFANLRSADLRSANLRSAKCDDIIKDFYAVLDVAKNEAVGLYRALLDGKIDGTQYRGECACLVGTIANCRKENHEKLGIDLRPDSNRPAERWFLAIKEGDIPENNAVSALTKEWIEKWAEKNSLKLPELTKVWVEAI